MAARIPPNKNLESTQYLVVTFLDNYKIKMLIHRCSYTIRKYIYRRRFAFSKAYGQQVKL